MSSWEKVAISRSIIKSHVGRRHRSPSSLRPLVRLFQETDFYRRHSMTTTTGLSFRNLTFFEWKNHFLTTPKGFNLSKNGVIECRPHEEAEKVGGLANFLQTQCNLQTLLYFRLLDKNCIKSIVSNILRSFELELSRRLITLFSPLSWCSFEFPQPARWLSDLNI